MSNRPIFMATHPRACSTAFERVFMTRRDILNCAHEPFGDAFYYGPERLSERFADDEEARIKSGFAKSTYRTIMDRLENDGKEGKRVFIKDIAHYLLPPNGQAASIAPSLVGGHPLTDNPDAENNTAANGDVTNHTNGFVNGPTNGTNGVPIEEDNPTVMPTDMLRGFHWTFLIRHPRKSIPSYYRCTIPPLDDITGFHDFMPSEAGYDELRRLFDYLLSQGIIGPSKAGETTPVDEALNAADDNEPKCSITVIDADDLLVSPEKILKVYAKEVGIDYKPSMLEWSDDENQQHAAKAFEKWYGFHHDAIESSCLKPRAGHHRTPSTDEENGEWVNKYGEEAAKVIREAVDANIPHYEYLKSFAVKV
ncbi:hypothetical protein VSDG_06188 [Cytospora chrysosperma]|uniref:P-loop containing nucleoside triphosphate hydrolase protein n=1 Tax=Cytospora chrysosperma TaxID=252740 RepID=A0A423VUF4_CYTCH|nr:hypothetical protein VSDG_06188 [Valsa sordida]